MGLTGGQDEWGVGGKVDSIEAMGRLSGRCSNTAPCQHTVVRLAMRGIESAFVIMVISCFVKNQYLWLCRKKKPRMLKQLVASLSLNKWSGQALESDVLCFVSNLICIYAVVYVINH